MNDRSSTTLKQNIAREAALLLYTSQEKEFKQAKLRAAQTLRKRILPSNIQVARELDRIADEMEGPTRKGRLLQMRREALQIMKSLEDFHPRLIGSVWRGTAHKDSDIDIITFSAEPPTVQAQLQGKSFKVTRTEWQSAPKLSRKERSFHIYLSLPMGNKAEVVVRSPERINKEESCEIYGDTLTGLNIHQLERVLVEDPFRKFVP